MRADAQAQPNIALVKYWGKRDPERNLPAVGSLSLTLDSLWTRMSVELDTRLREDSLSVNGQVDHSMLPRVSHCLDRLLGAKRRRAAVRSENNFPVAAGLASSASAFAALVVAASEAAKLQHDRLTLARYAGAASGSAARSLFDGIVELSAGNEEIDVRSIADLDAWQLQLVIAINDDNPKAVSSGAAMQRSARTSPFYASWVERQPGDLDIARKAVSERDFAALAAVAEHNCLKMHSLMWTSRPPVVYWNAVTLACMETVRMLQQDGCPVFFTIDAGPQVKAVCLPEVVEAVRSALSAIEGVRKVLTSGLGPGARILDAT